MTKKRYKSGSIIKLTLKEHGPEILKQAKAAADVQVVAANVQYHAAVAALQATQSKLVETQQTLTEVIARKIRLKPAVVMMVIRAQRRISKV